VRAGQYDGIVSLGIVEENWLEQVLKLGVPAVLVDFPAQTLRSQSDTVFADPYYAYRAAVENILERGCQRIHFVGARVRNPNQRIPGKKNSEGEPIYGRRIDPDTFLRLSAYRHAMDALGVEVQEDWIHFVDLEAEAHEALVRRMAKEPRDRWPQAVICHDVNQAEWLMKFFENRGWPLVGAGASGGTHFGEAMALPVNAKEMGEVASDLLVARLKRPERPYLNVGVRVARAESQATV
jgi:DNA-binding LacI/PurR family transcriptional regulator